MTDLEKAKERCERLAAAIQLSQDGGAIIDMQDRLKGAQAEFRALSHEGKI